MIDIVSFAQYLRICTYTITNKHTMSIELYLSNLEAIEFINIYFNIQIIWSSLFLLSALGVEKPVVNKSFVEKIASTFIKNIEVKIKNIHLRFEDR